MLPHDVIDEATRRLVTNFDPERIILFGSQTRGNADDRSDADFLVITRSKGKRRALMLAMDRSLRGLNLARDIIILTPEEYERERDIPGTIARPAAQEGKILYERA